MVGACRLLLVLGPALPAFAADVPGGPTQWLSLDKAWRFHLGDVPFPIITGHGMSYDSAKAGKAWGAAAPDYDDSAWRVVDLPHDWAVESAFDPKNNLSQGYRARGIGWYRRFLRLDSKDQNKSFELKFDGVSTHCTVWVNGNLVYRNWCGYTSFSIDLTPFATFDDKLNSIAIRVDADAMEGWWYEGAGIYRHTWLAIRQPVHLITDGVYACPVQNSSGDWEVPVEATLRNDGDQEVQAKVSVKLLDSAGKVAAQADGTVQVPSLGTAAGNMKMAVSNPQLWSPDSPTLYRVVTTVTQDGNIVDQNSLSCGFRTLHFDPDKGFFLNGQPLKLKGTCNHQDSAGVGVAVPDAIWDYRIRRLKEMGSNAYRCAHNPPAKEFLDACDRLGMLVMDENRNFNVSDECVRQLSWMVRRDRNHPSVILWSVFNEEPMQGSAVGFKMVRRMVAVVKALDRTRPVTAAMNGGLFEPINVSQAVDVVGFNYQGNEYDEYHQKNPTRCITSSEDTSSFMSRGVYETNEDQHVKDGYDDQHAGWGWYHRGAWKDIATRPFVAGGFTWTGFDYRGEPTPYGWPSVTSCFGIMDLCGFPKAAFYMHQAMYVGDRPILHLIPHWNWPGREGQAIKVMALTNADTVSLSLNGKLISEEPVAKYDMVTWSVPYAPGKLEAVAKKNGLEVARTSVETTGDPVALKLVPDRNHLDGDGLDAQPIAVMAVDGAGRPVPTANNPVTFAIAGPAKSIGVGNGDANSHEPEKGLQRNLYNGLAQLILQTDEDSSGTVTIAASSPGLAPGTAEIKISKADPIPYVPPTNIIISLANWKISPFSDNRPDPNQTISDNDRNTWAPVQAGSEQDFPGNSWAIYRTKFTPTGEVQDKGGVIDFRGILGTAEIYLDGAKIGSKALPGGGPLSVPVPSGKGERTLTVLIHSQESGKAGLSGLVVVRH